MGDSLLTGLKCDFEFKIFAKDYSLGGRTAGYGLAI